MSGEEELFRRLSVLDRASKTAFAAASAERLWPLVVRYSRSVAMPAGDLERLRAALDSAWQAAFGQAGDLAAAEEFAASMIPSDENWVTETGYAQMAIAAIAYAAIASWQSILRF
jgi:hypothetical protein